MTICINPNICTNSLIYKSISFIKGLFFLVFGLFCFVTKVYTQQPFSPLDSIISLQENSDSFFADGLIPSNRVHTRSGKTFNDDNIFYSAITAFSLLDAKKKCKPSDHLKIDKVVQNIRLNYPNYQSRRGRLTYNFWQMHPIEKNFPNDQKKSKKERYRLADDLDDSALIFLSEEFSSNSSNELKKLMVEQHNNLTKVRTTKREYRTEKAYPTWFADKMNQEFDMCVMSNILLFTLGQKPFVKADSNTMNLLKKMVNDDFHIKEPELAAPYYQNSATIIYHLSRLVSSEKHPELSSLKQKLIEDSEELLKTQISEFEKMIISISLIRLQGYQTITIDISAVKPQIQSFAWFCFSGFSTRPLWMRRISGKKTLKYDFISPAFNWFLVYEYETLNQKI